MTHVHPDWCGRHHLCTVDSSGGEHRSTPLTVDTDTARLVITRTRSRTGLERVEIRVVADLPTDPARARDASALIVGWVRHAVTRAQLTGGSR